jgi:hypothetical protein
MLFSYSAAAVFRKMIGLVFRTQAVFHGPVEKIIDSCSISVDWIF